MEDQRVLALVIAVAVFFGIPGARLSRTSSLLGPLTHLCDLEAGYGGVWAPNFGGAAPGFEPRTLYETKETLKCAKF